MKSAAATNWYALPILFALAATPAAARDLPFTVPANPATLDRAVRGLAKDLVTEHRNDRENLFRIQIAAQDYSAADTTVRRLIATRIQDPSALVRARDVPFAVYVDAMEGMSRTKKPFGEFYALEFRMTMAGLKNATVAAIVNNLSFDNLPPAKRALDADLAKQKGKNRIASEDAIQLIRDYDDVKMYSAIAPIIGAILDRDDAQRYVIEKDVAIQTSDRAAICALIVRPRAAPKLPALLQFTIYNDPATILRDARRAASNDYVGVIGLTRGKGCSGGPVDPYEHDGADAAALIDWIAAQPWSDGQVGMYGGSYSGFTPWAAAKHHPAALKTFVVGAPVAPGLDAPMEGNVFWNFIYPWPFYTTDNKTLDNRTYNDNARWQKLNRDWYISGRAYSDLDKIDGTPNPIFDRWVSHGDYDAYWQSLIPYRDEFADIHIPVLLTAGYYYGGPGSATYYFDQYQKHNPNADAYLVIGPYDHFMAQRGTATPDGNTTSFNGYTFDAAALQNFNDLRFAWFDHVLKGGPKPALLADHVNYEVTGANVWKHAPSLDAMANGHLRFYLSDTKSGTAYRFSDHATGNALVETMDFKDRSDVDAQVPGGGILDKAIDTTGGALEFVSDPFTAPTEMSGLFSGHLEFIASKKDFDFQISLYAQLPDGQYLQLAPYWSRASYVDDVTKRRLLTPGQTETLDFRAIRLMSSRLPVGSRLVAVLGVIKSGGQQINYGTGGTVASETVADASAPLTIRWSPTSYIDVPLGR